MADGRHFDDGHYWVQRVKHSEPELARYERGCWLLRGRRAPLHTADLYWIGRRFQMRPDAFEEEIEGEGRLAI